MITLLGARVAAAATLAVPGDHATVGAAVAAARPGDTIAIAAGTWAGAITIDRALTLVATDGPGTVVLTAPAAPAGDPVVRVLLGGDLTLEGITIGGGGRHRALWLDEGSVAMARHLAVEDPASGPYGDGGAMMVRDGATLVLEEPSLVHPPQGFQRGGYVKVARGTLIVRGGEVRDGIADPGDGGSIFAIGGRVEIDGVSFVGSRAAEAGGAISVVDGELVIRDSTFAGGSAGIGGSANGVGGAIFAWNAVVDVRDTVFRENTALRAGAVELHGSPSGMLVGVRFEGNTADEIAGALELTSGTAEVRGSVVCGSSAPTGGAFATGGDLLVDHSVVSSSTGDH
ncbi:MAG: hypothetical protein KC621_34885, partial [Myxococcales bacterium]|nr:hypothetical protein [Myxococcales bacterium]